MDSINGLRAFDWDGPVLSEPRSFVVRPSSAGGFEACAAALSRLLASAMEEGLWWATICLAEPHPNPGFAHLGPMHAAAHILSRGPRTKLNPNSHVHRGDGDHAQREPTSIPSHIRGRDPGHRS